MSQSKNEDASAASQAAGIARRLGKVVKGRVKEWVGDKNEELKESLRGVREELDEEIESLRDKKP